MSRHLDDLDPEFRSKVFELLARLVERGVHVKIIDTLRTPEEQAENLRKGVSWTRNSKHLPQPPKGLSKAIDLCPIKSYMGPGTTKLNWDNVNQDWPIIGEEAKKIGLKWGGDWKVKDLGHVELP